MVIRHVNTALSAILCAILLSACATVSRGTNDVLVVDTVPAGAKVTTDRVVGKNLDGSPLYAGCLATPCEIRIPRRSEFLMTIKAEGHEPVEVGVSGTFKREALRANLASSGKVGTAVGVTTFTALSSATGIFATSTGAAAGAGAATAGIMTGGILVASTLVDGATGALLSLSPNPIVLTLPPEGVEVPKHPKAEEIKEKRAKKAARRSDKKS